MPANNIFVVAPQESLTAVFTTASHYSASSVSWIQSTSATSQEYWHCEGSKNAYQNSQYWLWLEWNMLAFLSHSVLPLTENILSNDHSKWQSNMKLDFKHNSRNLTLIHNEEWNSQAVIVTADYPRSLANKYMHYTHVHSVL